MPKKTIDQVDVRGKRVVMRVDFNVPIEDGVIGDDRRIREALPSIKSVIDRGGRLILLSHLGRPEGKGYEAEYSLAPCANRLSELLRKPVGFPSQDCTDEKAAGAVKAMKDGDAALLENVRFHKGEKKGDPAFSAKLAAYGDIYCNDAFGTCHRPEASMVGVPKAMGSKPKVCGFLVRKEIKFLGEALESPKKPFVSILGGAKVSDKIGVVERLIPKCDAILIGGAMAYTFLKAMGKEVGASRVEADRIGDAKRMIDLAKSSKCDLRLPKDHIAATEFSESGGEIATFGDAIKPGFMGLDIGPATRSDFSGVIAKAKTIVWNGPMGVFEWPKFEAGTRQVAEAVATATKSGAISIVGGGDSAAAAEKFGVAERVSHVSTGGGASLEMLAGAQFESLAILDEA